MKKLVLYGVTFILVMLLIQCGSSAEKESNVSVIVTKIDSVVFKDTLNNNVELATKSEITCPNCGYKKVETMPTEVCLIKYSCEKCKTVLYPKAGDCCVFCTYGTHKCPSMQ